MNNSWPARIRAALGNAARSAREVPTKRTGFMPTEYTYIRITFKSYLDDVCGLLCKLDSRFRAPVACPEVFRNSRESGKLLDPAPSPRKTRVLSPYSELREDSPERRHPGSSALEIRGVGRRSSMSDANPAAHYIFLYSSSSETVIRVAERYSMISGGLPTGTAKLGTPR
jgi:hypothetical protein